MMGNILRKSLLKPGLEFIGYQSDKIGLDVEAQLTVLFEKIRDGVYPHDEKIPASDEVKTIVSLLKERFGLTFEVQTDQYLAAVLPFYSNRHHIFLNDFLRGGFKNKDQQKILIQSDRQEGTVNTEKGYVTGIFSKYVNELHLNFRKMFMEAKMTVPEVAAVMFHEVGHAFYACEYSDRLESNNQILADVFRESLKNNEKRDMVYMYRELNKINPEVTEKEVDLLVNGTKVIAGYTWFKIIIGTLESQMPNSNYDRTAFESSADNFAGRIGYGRQLISALEKWYGAEGTKLDRRGADMIYVMSALSLFGLMAVILTSIVTLPIVAMYLSFVVGVLLGVNRSDVKDLTYDDLKTRYTRIRNDLIEFLKRSDAKEDKILDAVNAIKSIDAIISNTFVAKNIYEQIANVIYSKARAAERTIKEQKMLESLVFNELFVKSAELAVVS